MWESLRDARQKSTKRGTQHWWCEAPALLAWMDLASTSSELHSDTGSIADSDLREVDLELAAATAPTLSIRSLYPSEFGRGVSRHCSRSGPDHGYCDHRATMRPIELCACATSGHHI